MKNRRGWCVGGLLAGALLVVVACQDDDDESTGQACSAADQCYGRAEAPVRGTTLCLDRVSGGYCTHSCVTDADCCAVKGECQTGHPQVCAPFESTGQRLCFLSCEVAVLTAGQEGTAYCQGSAHQSFSCRSSGGGADNRKVCVP
jgi:hypothetical protein